MMMMMMMMLTTTMIMMMTPLQDGFRTSTYTQAVEPTLAHALLWPARVVFRVFGLDIVSPIIVQGKGLCLLDALCIVSI